MAFFLRASMLVVLFLSIGLAKAEEKLPVITATQETVPPPPNPESEDLKVTMSLDDATKKVMQDIRNKVLAAKTEVDEGKKIHIIKILTATGHIQYLKIDAATGNFLDKAKK